MRRREYDVVRGLAVVFMIAVHVLLTVYDGSSAVVSRIVDFFGSAPAAPVFMFLLGCNVLVSRHNEPRELFMRGLKLFLGSYVFNAVCHASAIGVLAFGALTCCAGVRAESRWDEPQLLWYASRGSVACTGVPASGAELRIVDSSDRVACERTVGGIRAVVAVTNGVDVLPNGSYRAELRSSGSLICTHDFVHTNYPWFNTSVGRADILLPGFTPLRATGMSVEAVGRRYVFANGLPSQVWSLGRQILARPVALVMSPSKLAPAPFVFGKRTDTRIDFACGRIAGHVEQDGLIAFSCNLPETKGFVTLEIPVKREFATLFHACGDAIRCNPAGAIPSGTGRVFASRSIKGAGMTTDNFLPYCWIGTDTRGICFAADTDRGWVHGPKRDAVEIHREADGTVVLKLNLIAEEGLHAARKIEFALQASPVKPMPDGWRGWVDAYDVPGTRNMLCQPSLPTWGCYIGGMARYPTFGDWAFVRKMAESARTGKCHAAYLGGWIQRCLAARKHAPALVPWLAAKKDDAKAEADLRAHAGAAMKRPVYLATKAKRVLYYYTCDHDPCGTLYEMPVMADEWGTQTAVFGSHQDYAVYYLKKMCENGMNGVYNDNAFLKANRDWVTGGAWFDEKGTLHPNYGISTLREYARRQIVAMLEAGVREPWLTIHHTNANVLPVLAFATNAMGMEDKYGTPGKQVDWQDRWPRNYVRTVNQGLQAGCLPTSIEGPFYDKADRTRLTRTMLATLLPHEIQPTLSQTCDTALVKRVLGMRQQFGVASNDCVYTAYYDPENPVVQADDDVMVSAYRRGNRLLLVVGSYRKGSVDLPIRVRDARIISARNIETGAALPCKFGTATLALEPHGFALLEVKIDCSC